MINETNAGAVAWQNIKPQSEIRAKQVSCFRLCANARRKGDFKPSHLLQSVTISEAEEKYILLIKIKLIKNIIALKFSIVSITQNIAPE